jgi:hypothetical protein
MSTTGRSSIRPRSLVPTSTLPLATKTSAVSRCGTFTTSRWTTVAQSGRAGARAGRRTTRTASTCIRCADVFISLPLRNEGFQAMHGQLMSILWPAHSYVWPAHVHPMASQAILDQQIQPWPLFVSCSAHRRPSQALAHSMSNVRARSCTKSGTTTTHRRRLQSWQAKARPTARTSRSTDGQEGRTTRGVSTSGGARNQRLALLLPSTKTQTRKIDFFCVCTVSSACVALAQLHATIKLKSMSNPSTSRPSRLKQKKTLCIS